MSSKKLDKTLGAKLPKCTVCEIKFARFCDLEWHLKAKHEECTQFKCDKCKKTFVTTWRLKKHSKIHSKKITKQWNKTCNYHYVTPSAMPRPLHVPVTPPWCALALIHILKKKKSKHFRPGDYQNLWGQHNYQCQLMVLFWYAPFLNQSLQ